MLPLTLAVHCKSFWLRYSQTFVEDEHSSEPSTRPSSRSTSALVLFEVAPAWSILAPMIGVKYIISDVFRNYTKAYPSGYPARNCYGAMLRRGLNFLQRSRASVRLRYQNFWRVFRLPEERFGPSPFSPGGSMVSDMIGARGANRTHAWSFCRRLPFHLATHANLVR